MERSISIYLFLILRNQTNAKNGNINFLKTDNIDQMLVGPHRVFPGRLSVSPIINSKGFSYHRRCGGEVARSWWN